MRTALSAIHADADLPAIMSATSTGIGFGTITGCLQAAENDLGLSPDWSAAGVLDPAGRRSLDWFLTCLPLFRTLVGALPVKAVASRSADVINAFADAERVPGMRIEPLNEGEFAMLSVLKLAMSWREKGYADELTAHDGRKYVAATLGSIGDFRRTERHPHPIVSLPTTDAKRVILTEITAIQAGLAPTELFAAAQGLLADLGKAGRHEGCSRLTFPKTKLAAQPDLGWLEGLATRGPEGDAAMVAKAGQKIGLEMDENGARIEEKTGMRGYFTESLPPPPLVVRGPFLAALVVPTADGQEQVACAFRVGTDAWTKA